MKSGMAAKSLFLISKVMAGSEMDGMASGKAKGYCHKRMLSLAFMLPGFLIAMKGCTTQCRGHFERLFGYIALLGAPGLGRFIG